MTSQSVIWLYPLVFMSLFALVFYLRLGIRWTWGLCWQAVLILTVALLGFALHKYTSICAWLGWGLFSLFVIFPRTMLNRLERNLALLNPKAAILEANRLRYFLWGPPGRFWLDMCQVTAYFLNGDNQSAESLIENWRKFPLPRSTRYGLVGYLLSGKIILRDWQGIILEYNYVKNHSSGQIRQSLANAACRAYLELGLINDAIDCLKLADIPAARLTKEALYMSFVPFFSLSGAESELLSCFDSLRQIPNALPEYARLYWLGRCQAAQGKYEESRQTFLKAIDSTPQTIPIWNERINYQLKKTTDTTQPITLANWSNQIACARSILRHALTVGEVIAPSTPRWATIFLVAFIIGSYALSHLYSIFPSPGTLLISLNCFRFGVLDTQMVMSGQYWRLLSYLFLHSHISHVVLNIVGLWWFGKLAENLYGTMRFLFIYFSTGILSGLAHIFLSPGLMAVGASGAVMGIFGATCAGIFRAKVVPPSLRKTEVSYLLGLALAQIVLDQVVPNVAVFAHLGGLIAGLMLGLIIPLRKLDL